MTYLHARTKEKEKEIQKPFQMDGKSKEERHCVDSALTKIDSPSHNGSPPEIDLVNSMR